MSSINATIVLTPRSEGILAVNRTTLKAVTFPSNTKNDLFNLMKQTTNYKPEWFIDALKQVAMTDIPKGQWRKTSF